MVAVLFRGISLVWFIKACDHPVGSLSGLICHLMFRFTAWVSVMSAYISYIPISVCAVIFVGHVAAVLSPMKTFLFIEQCAHGRNLSTLRSFSREE